MRLSQLGLLIVGLVMVVMSDGTIPPRTEPVVLRLPKRCLINWSSGRLPPRMLQGSPRPGISFRHPAWLYSQKGNVLVLSSWRPSDS